MQVNLERELLKVNRRITMMSMRASYNGNVCLDNLEELWSPFDGQSCHFWSVSINAVWRCALLEQSLNKFVFLIIMHCCEE